MPANKRPRRVNYSVNKKGPITGNKVWKAISHYKTLQKRISVEWETKWIRNALQIVTQKLDKYGIDFKTL